MLMNLLDSNVMTENKNRTIIFNKLIQ